MEALKYGLLGIIYIIESLLRPLALPFSALMLSTKHLQLLLQHQYMFSPPYARAHPTPPSYAEIVRYIHANNSKLAVLCQAPVQIVS